MPIILPPRTYARWLDPAFQNVAELADMLQNEIVTELVSYPVSRHVNSVRNNDPSCIEPLCPPPPS
jgi:putative SOS response-associated peptidase YedK